MPASKYKIERKCEVCGNTFFAKTLASKYCSRHCGEVAYRQRRREEKKLQQQKEIADKVQQERLYISISEAVAMFGVSRDTLYRLIRKNKLPAINLSERLIRISRAHIEAMFPKIEISEVKKEAPAPVEKRYKFDASDSYTIGEVSKKFGISDSTIYKAIRKNAIPTCQRGKYVFVPKKEIEKVLNVK